MNIADITITSLETIRGYDIVSDAHLFTLDELQNATIANTEEKTDITGKAGRKLNSLKRAKAVTVSGTNGIVSGDLLAVQTGGTFASAEDAAVKWTEYLTVKDDAAATTYKAVGTTGNEIGSVYVRNPDGSVDTVLTQNSTAAAGKFAYAPSTKTITFNTDELEDGTEIVVHYIRNIQASVLTNLSDIYSTKAKLYVDAMGEDKCGNTYRIQFYIPKADFSGNFNFEMGDNQTVQAFEAESLPGSCGLGGALWTYTVFGANAADYSGD